MYFHNYICLPLSTLPFSFVHCPLIIFPFSITSFLLLSCPVLSCLALSYVFLSYKTLFVVCIVVVVLPHLPDRKTIFFNSHQVSKPESSSDLTAVSIINDIKTTPYNYSIYHVLKCTNIFFSLGKNVRKSKFI